MKVKSGLSTNETHMKTNNGPPEIHSPQIPAGVATLSLIINNIINKNKK